MKDYAAILRRYGVPEHLHDGLVLYLTHGIPPGSFLLAALSGDLMEAFARADEASRAGMFAVVSFLYNDAPASAWGDPERVRGWMDALRAGGEVGA